MHAHTWRSAPVKRLRIEASKRPLTDTSNQIKVFRVWLLVTTNLQPQNVCYKISMSSITLSI